MQGIIGIECEVVILRLDQGCCKPEGDEVLINTQEIGMVVDRQQSGGDQSLLESLRQAQRPNFQRTPSARPGHSSQARSLVR